MSIVLLFAVALLICSFLWAAFKEHTVSSTILAIWAADVLYILGAALGRV